MAHTCAGHQPSADELGPRHFRDRLTFQEAVIRADAAVVPFVEATSAQRVSAQVQKISITPDGCRDCRSQGGRGAKRPRRRVPCR